MSFTNYVESGPSLLTGAARICGTFRLEGTSMTVANTLRRAILTETRSVGFRADLTDPTNPGIRINKNTSVVFNEMLAHRLTLLPLGVVRIDDFKPERYECVLRKRHDGSAVAATAPLHVKASDFQLREKQEDGTWVDLPAAAVEAMFPADPITRDTSLLVTLRPQWNPEQPPEEVDLVAYPVVAKGRDFMGFSPVAQATFGNTIDPDPVRQERFFYDWMAAYKKVSEPSSLPPEVMERHRKEWQTMAVQRCFIVDEFGEPTSFDFTVESVGIRPVPDIVAEALRAVIDLVRPYASAETAMEELGIRAQPPDSRMVGIDLNFDGQEHTLGCLLQAFITELYLDSASTADTPIAFVGYKVKHPLKREVTLRFGMRDASASVSSEATVGVARQAVAAAAARAVTVFEELGRSWASVAGPSSGSAASGASGAGAGAALEG
jgi:DNA-directed RNA polymerase subunit L